MTVSFTRPILADFSRVGIRCITPPWPGPPSDILKSVPLFAGLDDRELEQIASTMRERQVRRGDTVTEEGAGGAGFFVVESGEADVSVDGQARGSIKAGDYFGEIALLTGSDRTATITAKTDMDCWGMTPWDFRPLVESNSTIAWKLLTAMADKLSSQRHHRPPVGSVARMEPVDSIDYLADASPRRDGSRSSSGS